MAITLYHRTTKDAVEKILAEGFKAGSRGDVWVSKFLDSWGEEGRHLLEIKLEVPEEVLEKYGRDVISDQIQNEAGKWVKCPPEEAKSYRWYEVPPETLNEFATVRAVSREEAKEIAFETGCD